MQLATASETTTLSSLIDEAKKNNPEILAYQKRVKAKEARANIEGILDDPQLKVEIEDIPGGRPFNLGDSMQTRYTFSQTLPFPGKLSLKQKAAAKEVLMAESEAKNKKLEIVTMLKEAYFDYAFLVESIKIAHEIKGIISQMADIAGIRYATNLASQQDVIKAQVELTVLNNELITLEAEKDVIAAKINSLLSRDTAAPLGEPEDIKAYRVKVTQGLSLELQKIALEKSPTLKAMEYDIQAREAEIELNKKSYYPDFMIGVAPIQRDGRFDTYDLMFSVNLPIWWGKYDNQVSEARANAEILRTSLKAEQNIKTFDVREASVKVEAADRVRTVYETTLLPQADFSFQSAKADYQTGKVDFLTMLESERALRKTKIEYIKSVVEYRKDVALLEKAVGEELEAMRLIPNNKIK
ncbi:MAG: TolC family protein [Deltaproteobacteria bacterium]|nr:TolC family protein [Deltaproteobacteria bacterium]